MKTIFKIKRKTSKVTYVHEYWDDILIYKFKVYADYQGGDIIDFLNNNTVIRTPNFDGISEFHRRIFILDF